MIIPAVRPIGTGAFRGPLNCPFCNHDGQKISRWKFVEHLGLVFIVRYQCKDCGRIVKYDYSNNSHFMTSKPWERQGIPSLYKCLKQKFNKAKRQSF